MAHVDKKTSELATAATVLTTDLLDFVVDPAGTPTSKKAAISVLATLLNTSPALTSVPTAPTAALATNTTQVATTAFVIANVGTAPVSSVFARTGAVVKASGDYAVADVTGAAPLASPTFTGTITTPAVGVSYVGSTSGTTAIRAAAVAGTTIVTMPGTTGTMALTADITGTNSNTNTGDDATNSQYSGLAASKANLAGPAFTGTPTADTASEGTNTTQLASTAYVMVGMHSDHNILANQVFG